MKKCEACGQDREFVPIFLKSNVFSFVHFEAEKCSDCGRLPANNPAVVQALENKKRGG